MTDPIVLVLEEEYKRDEHGSVSLADFQGNRLVINAATYAQVPGRERPIVARVEIAAPEVEGEPA